MGVLARNDVLRAYCRLVRGIWKRSSGYFRRSVVETHMYCSKRLTVRAFARQDVRLHAWMELLNRLT